MFETFSWVPFFPSGNLKEENLDDPSFEVPDGVTLRRSAQRDRLFYQMNLITSSEMAFQSIFCNNYPVICADPPWSTNLVKSGCYNLEDDEVLVTFFRERVSSLFQPNNTEKEGVLFLWYLTNKRTLALRCLYAAGYEVIADDSWNKTNIDGNDRKMSIYRGMSVNHFIRFT